MVENWVPQLKVFCLSVEPFSWVPGNPINGITGRRPAPRTTSIIRSDMLASASPDTVYQLIITRAAAAHKSRAT